MLWSRPFTLANSTFQSVIFKMSSRLCLSLDYLSEFFLLTHRMADSPTFGKSSESFQMVYWPGIPNPMSPACFFFFFFLIGQWHMRQPQGVVLTIENKTVLAWWSKSDACICMSPENTEICICAHETLAQYPLLTTEGSAFHRSTVPMTLRMLLRADVRNSRTPLIEGSLYMLSVS